MLKQENKAVASESSMKRAFTPLMAWALALGCTVGWGAFVMPGTTFLPEAGPLGTAIAFVIGALAMLVVACNYGYMARLYPGQGGIYRYIHESFGPNHAFVCSWCLVLAYSASMVSNATALALVLRSAFGPFMQIGPHYVVAGYDVYLLEALSGVAIIALAALLCFKSTHLTGLIETVLALGLVLGTIVIAALAVFSPQASLSAPAFSPHHSSLAGMLTVLAMVPWAFIGFESVTQFSDECRFSTKYYARIMGIAIACGALMYLVYNTVAASVVPDGYGSWVAYLDDLGSQEGLAAVPTFYSGYRMSGTFGLVIYAFTAICGVLTGVVGFYLVVTRLIHAMASDRALPARFARVSKRYGTPDMAVKTILVATLAVPFIGRIVLSWILDLMSLGALIAYTYVSIAVLLRARREGSMPMRAMGLAGATISGICILLLVVPLPGLSTSLTKESYIILLAWVALGVNFFTPTIER